MLWIMGTSLLAYGLAIAFVALTGVFSKPAQLTQREPVRWMRPVADPSASTDLRYQLLDLVDPSLSSLPNRHGFSQAMWRKSVAATFRSPVFRAPVAMLPGELPAPFDCITGPLSAADLTVGEAAKNTEPPILTKSPLDNPSQPATNTAYRLTGPLGTNHVVRPPVLSPVASDIPLRPTRLLIGVNGMGQVCYRLLERSSGSQAADQQARDAAGKMLFAVPQANGLTWGILHVMWAVSEPTLPPTTPSGTGNTGP
jgi:hypothetical protein